jgi:hypothetical protein
LNTTPLSTSSLYSTSFEWKVGSRNTYTSSLRHEIIKGDGTTGSFSNIFINNPSSQTGSYARVSSTFTPASAGVNGDRQYRIIGQSFASGSSRIHLFWRKLQLEQNDHSTTFVSGSRNTWVDLSGNNNNGTLLNNPLYNSGSRGGIVFNGTSNYVDCGYTMNFSSNFTIELAFKTLFTGSNGIMCSKYDFTDPNFWFGVDNNKLKFSISVGTGGGKVEPASIPNVNDGNWYIGHAVYDSTTYTVSVYLNSILQSSITGNTAFTDTNRSYYIARFNPTAVYFPGTIAYNKIYNRALSASEIAQNYNAQKSRFNL